MVPPALPAPGARGAPSAARRLVPLLAAALLLVASTARGQALTTERVASGLALPVYVTAPDGDFDRVFLVELGGLVKILRAGVVEPQPFLDLTALVQTSPNFEGLFGIAFHPQYASNGHLYVVYADLADNVVLERYTVSGDPDVVDPASRQRVLAVPTPLDGHEGGAPLFGPDGYLYWALGDSEPQNDLNCNGQNADLLIGKLLRLDVDADDFPGDPERNYAVPADNPFVGDPTRPDEVFAIGFRNPWRSSFDRATGDLWVSDNGQDAMEEIDLLRPTDPFGRNFGWPVMEGSLCFPNMCAPGTPVCNGPNLTLPFFEYDHTVGCSVIGGYVYRGAAMPALHGTYFYGDFCGSTAGGGIFSFEVAGGAVVNWQDRSLELDPGGGLDIQAICSWGEDAAGELYVVEHFAGEVFKLVPDTGAFVDLGPFGVPGAAGEPVMSGSGDLTPGSATGYTIEVVGAPPSSLGFVFYGTQVAAVPFYGGTFYPFPFLNSIALPFDAQGELTVDTALPASVPGGLSLAQQIFFLDPTALHGVTGTNGLRLDLP